MEAPDVHSWPEEEPSHDDRRYHSKKEKILSLGRQGGKDILKIANEVGCRPSYVAQTLQEEGVIHGYFDLYTSTKIQQNVYSPFFRDVLSFKDVESARQSLEQIDSLYNYFESVKDRAGQHHAMLLALTGKNRARWSGKPAEADIFHRWLCEH